VEVEENSMFNFFKATHNSIGYVPHSAWNKRVVASVFFSLLFICAIFAVYSVQRLFSF